jgi:hypothetical protein
VVCQEVGHTFGLDHQDESLARLVLVSLLTGHRLRIAPRKEGE